MYICDDPVCDPVCDFCWFCEHGAHGEPVSCLKNNDVAFLDGLGYCDAFKCSIHETSDVEN
jgi:hypothetical protein